MEQTHLRKVKIEGYKSIRSAEIDFQPGLNIIIGKNASGKTNFLEFVSRMLSLPYLSGLKNNYFSNFDSFFYEIYKSASKNILSLSIKNAIEDSKITFRKNKDEPITEDFDDNSYKFFLLINESENLQVKRFFFTYSIPNRVPYINTPSRIDISKRNFVTEFDTDSDLNFDMSFLFNRNLIPKLQQKLLEDNIRKFLDQKQPDYIINNLRDFSPIQDIRFSKNYYINSRIDSAEINNIFVEFLVNHQWLPWASLSDGTKRLFYIISVISSENSESVFLLEEPELGIHPHQLHLLMQFLKEQAETKQIIITTHSPQVLNILSKDELDKIIICEMTEEGTKLRHLDEKQKEKARYYLENEAFLSDYWIYSDLEPQTA
jgi:predicted ATP-dependent endonuclease of OLD family